MNLEDDTFNAPAWHAQHPGRSERYPLCGTVGIDGRPTHRVSVKLTTTCKKCLRILAAKEFAAKVLGPNVGIEQPRSGRLE
jgi:hypothetical protein